jgi:hypothetical protein
MSLPSDSKFSFTISSCFLILITFDLVIYEMGEHVLICHLSLVFFFLSICRVVVGQMPVVLTTFIDNFSSFSSLKH